MNESVTAAALVEADDLRIDVGGEPACDGLSFRTTGSRVLVLGAPWALFAATTGLRAVVRGALRVRGVSAARAAADALIAGAAADPPLPPQWTVSDYVAWSARLAGAGRLDARSAAEVAIERLQLGPMAKTSLARLVPHARRATVVAAALATSAEVIALDDPLAGLADDVAATYAKILADGLEGRAWLVFAGRIAPGSPLAAAADEAIVCTATRLEAQGAPADLAAKSRRFVGRLAGAAGADLALALASRLEARGAHIEAGEAHVVFDLGPDVTTSELFAICADAGVAVIELVPVVRAFG